MAKKFKHYRQVSWDIFQAWNNTPTVLEFVVEIPENTPFYELIEKKGELTIFMISSDSVSETPEPSRGIISPQDTPDVSII